MTGDPVSSPTSKVSSMENVAGTVLSIWALPTLLPLMKISACHSLSVHLPLPARILSHLLPSFARIFSTCLTCFSGLSFAFCTFLAVAVS